MNLLAISKITLSLTYIQRKFIMSSTKKQVLTISQGQIRKGGGIKVGLEISPN